VLRPRLASHIELQFEWNGVAAAVAGFEVMGGAPGTFECLDFTDHDAVHQAAGPLGSVGTIGGQSVACRAGFCRLAFRIGLHWVARVGEPLSHVRLHEPLVAGKVFDRKELTHDAPLRIDV
jgi:hypothetical protein